MYGDAALFGVKFFGKDELITQSNIIPSEYKTLYPLFTFDVSNEKEKFKSSAIYINEYIIISPLYISWISTVFGLLRMCFRKLYLEFISFLVFSRPGRAVIDVMCIVSGNNPLLNHTSTSSDLL